jgi:hypothetical protein
LYDDFRICNIITGEIIYTVVPNNGEKCINNSKAELWGPENDFKGPIVAGTWNDIKAYFYKP